MNLVACLRWPDKHSQICLLWWRYSLPDSFESYKWQLKNYDKQQDLHQIMGLLVVAPPGVVIGMIHWLSSAGETATLPPFGPKTWDRWSDDGLPENIYQWIMRVIRLSRILSNHLIRSLSSAREQHSWCLQQSQHLGLPSHIIIWRQMMNKGVIRGAVVFIIVKIAIRFKDLILSNSSITRWYWMENQPVDKWQNFTMREESASMNHKN